jgi:hypothetical protein
VLPLYNAIEAVEHAEHLAFDAALIRQRPEGSFMFSGQLSPKVDAAMQTNFCAGARCHLACAGAREGFRLPTGENGLLATGSLVKLYYGYENCRFNS